MPTKPFAVQAKKTECFKLWVIVCVSFILAVLKNTTRNLVMRLMHSRTFRDKIKCIFGSETCSEHKLLLTLIVNMFANYLLPSLYDTGYKR